MKKSAAVMAVLGLGLGGSAFAQSTVWNWGTGTGTCDPSDCIVGGVKATVAGYGAESAGGLVQGATVKDLDPNSGVGLGITSAYENTTSPNHAIDNKGGSNSSGNGADYAEFLGITFDKAVALTQVAVSWTWTDSDAMIFRWDGYSTSTPAPANLTTLTASALPTAVGTTASNGWTLVAASQFANSSGAAGQINLSGAKYSSHWLVSTALGQTNSTSNPYNTSNDGFKISTFTGNVCAYAPTNGACTPPSGGGTGGTVPEPGSLALAGLALLGLVGSRRGFKAAR